MTDLDVIQQFYQQISWADQCREVQESNRTLLVTPCALCVPTHWQDFERNKAFIISVAPKYSLSPQLLIWGEPSDYETEKIWWDVMTSSHPRVYAKFIDIQASLLDAELLLKAFEGADISQTLANFMAGKPEVVWTWDKDNTQGDRNYSAMQAQPLTNDANLSVEEQIDQHASLVCHLPEQALRISVCRTLYYFRLRRYHGLSNDWSIYETLVRNYVKYCSESSLHRLVAEIVSIYSWHTNEEA